MANDLSTRQWRLDTPIPFISGPFAVLWHSTVWIKSAEFSSTGLVLPECKVILKDRTGRIIWESVALAERMPTRLGDIGWVNGLCLDHLTPGTLCVVYIR